MQAAQPTDLVNKRELYICSNLLSTRACDIHIFAAGWDTSGPLAAEKEKFSGVRYFAAQRGPAHRLMIRSLPA